MEVKVYLLTCLSCICTSCSCTFHGHRSGASGRTIPEAGTGGTTEGEGAFDDDPDDCCCVGGADTLSESDSPSGRVDLSAMAMVEIEGKDHRYRYEYIYGKDADDDENENEKRERKTLRLPDVTRTNCKDIIAERPKVLIMDAVHGCFLFVRCVQE